MSNGPVRPADDVSPALQDSITRMRAMRADLESTSRAPQRAALRFRLIRRDTPLGVKQLEVLYNDANLHVARMVAVEIATFPYYEVWYFDSSTPAEVYDHQDSSILEQREVISPAAVLVDKEGARILPSKMEVEHDDPITYDGALSAAEPHRTRPRRRRRADPERS